jgi:hypothetical protein
MTYEDHPGEAPRSSYIADVLKRGETEGGQITCQCFSNAGSVPPLGKEGRTGNVQ